MIRFDHVSYAYTADKSHPAIREISLTVDRGEELAIMGGNGCGKTTLGLLLCGVLKPDSGQVSIDGKILAAAHENTAVGFLFQDPDNGLVATTVEREIAFSLENRNMPSEEMRGIVDRIVDLFDMNQFRDRLVWNLSGGEKQRLALAGLFAAGSKILFLDEPASYLDYSGAARLDEALQQVRGIDPEITIIRVTQYPLVADRYGRVIIMSDGGILGDGLPGQIFADSRMVEKAGLRSPYKYLSPKPVSEIKASSVRVEPPPQDHPLVRLDEVSFEYEPEAAIFEGLSLTIGRGEVLGLVGQSGSGKSTLAQIICGIYRPTEGTISFMNDGRRAVMSFQQPERQFFLDNCYDEIAYGIKNKLQSDTVIEQRVRHCMETVGLDYEIFKNRDPHSLSGGEARRLGFAIMVALEADLVIFDEPTCGLDENGLRAFKKMLENLKADGRTIVIISHNSDIIADLTDRVGLVAGGKIAAVLGTSEFFASGIYKGILSLPEIIEYQNDNYGKAATMHPDDIFDSGLF